MTARMHPLAPRIGTSCAKYAQKYENRPPKFGLIEPCMAASASLELLATANRSR